MSHQCCLRDGPKSPSRVSERSLQSKSPNRCIHFLGDSPHLPSSTRSVFVSFTSGLYQFLSPSHQLISKQREVMSSSRCLVRRSNPKFEKIHRKVQSHSIKHFTPQQIPILDTWNTILCLSFLFGFSKSLLSFCHIFVTGGIGKNGSTVAVSRLFLQFNYSSVHFFN